MLTFHATVPERSNPFICILENLETAHLLNHGTEEVRHPQRHTYTGAGTALVKRQSRSNEYKLKAAYHTSKRYKPPTKLNTIARDPRVTAVVVDLREQERRFT